MQGVIVGHMSTSRTDGTDFGVNDLSYGAQIQTGLFSLTPNVAPLAQGDWFVPGNSQNIPNSGVLPEINFINVPHTLVGPYEPGVIAIRAAPRTNVAGSYGLTRNANTHINLKILLKEGTIVSHCEFQTE